MGWSTGLSPCGRSCGALALSHIMLCLFLIKLHNRRTHQICVLPKAKPQLDNVNHVLQPFHNVNVVILRKRLPHVPTSGKL